MTTDTIVDLSWYQRLSVRSLLTKSLSDRRIMTVLVGAGIGIMAILVTAMYPSLEESLADFDLGAGFDAFLGGVGISSPEGWLSAETWSIMAPIAIVALAIVDAGRSIAAEEEERSIGLLGSNPMSRTRILTAKSIAIVVHVCVASAIIGAMSWAAIVVVDLDMDASLAFAAAAHLALLGVMFGGFAVLVSAAVGKRMRSVLIVSAIAGISYIVATMLPISEDFATWAKVSPWFYYWGDVPLVNGVNWGYLGVMALIASVAFGSAIAVFQRRDLPA